MVTLTGNSAHVLDCPRFAVPALDVRQVRLIE
jgi:hypothetical protein